MSKSTFIYHFDRCVNIVVTVDGQYVCVQFTNRNLLPIEYLGMVTNFPDKTITYLEYMDCPDFDAMGYLNFYQMVLMDVRTCTLKN